VREVREESSNVRRIAFLLWIFAFLVCLAFLGFIAYGYFGNALDRFPKLG
jgi:amino acid permease